MDKLDLNSTFSSFEDLEFKIKQYESEHYIELYKRDSKLLKSLTKKCPRKLATVNDNLKYYRIVYACAKGGKKFVSRGLGKRTVSTCREGCPFQMCFTLTSDSQSLVLSKIVRDHSHEIQKEVFKCLPKQRRLNSEETQNVKNLLDLRCNRVLLKDYIHRKTGKNLSLHDISNLRIREKSKEDLQLKGVVDILKKDLGAVVTILADENETLTGIYFQSSAMLASFKNYPEMFLLDATYKLNNLRMPLNIIMVINGNGEGEVAATFLLGNETSDNISHMIQIFKSSNSSWEKTSVIFTDKDFTERKVLKQEFPNSSILLCLFHTLKSFRTNITMDAMSINSYQRDTVLAILQGLAFAKSENDYDSKYKSLLELQIPQVTKYYNANWHIIRKEWVECFKRGTCSFNITTTNHLESFNQKIKQVCSKFSNLKLFYEDFLVLLDSVMSERKRKASMMFYRNKIFKHETGSPTDLYSKLVTPYALKFIEKQLTLCEKVKIVSEEQDFCMVNTLSLDIIKVSVEDCPCPFRVNMKLPCSHIFAVRRRRNESLYSSTLIDERFKKSYYIKNVLSDFPTDQSIPPTEQCYDNENRRENVSVCHVKETTTISTQQQKYKKCMSKCQELATVMSEFGETDFKKCFFQLELLVENWNNRKQVMIIPEEEITYEPECSNSKVDSEMVKSQHKIPASTTIPLVEQNFEEMVDSHSKDLCILNNNEFVINDNVSCKETEMERQSDVIVDPTTLVTNVALKNPELSKIKLPLKLKLKGRPKGITKTVVGLKKRRKMIPFINQTSTSRQKKILLCIFSDQDIVSNILYHKYIVQPNDLPKHCQLINCMIFEEEVDIKIIEIFFESSAFLMLQKLITEREIVKKFFCMSCKKCIENELSLRCNSCLMRVHQICSTKFKLPRSNSKWYCVNCK